MYFMSVLKVDSEKTVQKKNMIGTKRKGTPAALDLCEENAIKLKHTFIAKIGPLAGTDFRSFTDPDDFVDQFFSQEIEEAYEQYYQHKERMLYFDTDGYYSEQLKDFEIECIVTGLFKIIKDVCKVTRPIFLIFHSNRWIDEKKWKLSLHVIVMNIKCPAGKSLRIFYEVVKTYIEKDEKMSKLFIRDGQCLLDPKVYNQRGLLRTPFSRKSNDKGDTLLRLLEIPPLTLGVLNDQRFLLWSGLITNTTNRFDFQDGKQFEIPMHVLEDNLFNISEKKRFKRSLSSEVKLQQNINSITIREILENLLKSFQGGDNGYLTLSTSDRKFYIRSRGIRYCPHGVTHKSNGAIFYVCGQRIDYYCLSEKCQDKDALRFFPIEMKKLPVCEFYCSFDVTNSTLDTSLFRKLERVYTAELQPLNLKDNKEIDAEHVKNAYDLCFRWKHDVHAIINHFLKKIEGEDTKVEAVMMKYAKLPYGEIRRRYSIFSHEDLEKRLRAKRIFFPQIQRKKDQLVWKMKSISLAQYYCGKQSIMDDCDMIKYEGVEMYPALPLDDTRKDKPQNVLNTFNGLAITAQIVHEYQSKLNGENLARDLHDRKLMLDHHLHGIFNGNEAANTWMLRYLALTWRKPWIKVDIHPNIYKAPTRGKSLFYSQFQNNLYGKEYGRIVSSIDDLNPKFNSHLMNRLNLVLEEVAGASSHKLHRFLKGLFDRTSTKTCTTKYAHDKECVTYFKAIFLTNEKFVQLTSLGERRWFFWEVLEDDWIDQQAKRTTPFGSDQNFKDRNEYFAYLAQIDIRCWASILMDQEIDHFSPIGDAPETSALIEQKTFSLSKTEPILAFWNHLSLNEPEMKNNEALSTKPWEFKPCSEQEWKKIDQVLSTLPTIEQEMKDLLVKLRSQPFDPKVCDSKVCQEIYETLIEHAPEKAAEWMTFRYNGLNKDDFYTQQFLPFKTNLERNRYALKENSTTFWRRTKELFGDTFCATKRKNGHRVFNLPNLHNLRLLIYNALKKK